MVLDLPEPVERRRTDRPPHRWAVFVDAGYLYGAGGALVHGVSSRRELRVDGPALVAALMERAAATMPGERLRLYWFDAARSSSPKGPSNRSDESALWLRKHSTTSG